MLRLGISQSYVGLIIHELASVRRYITNKAMQSNIEKVEREELSKQINGVIDNISRLEELQNKGEIIIDVQDLLFIRDTLKDAERLYKENSNSDYSALVNTIKELSDVGNYLNSVIENSIGVGSVVLVYENYELEKLRIDDRLFKRNLGKLEERLDEAIKFMEERAGQIHTKHIYMTYDELIGIRKLIELNKRNEMIESHYEYKRRNFNDKYVPVGTVLRVTKNLKSYGGLFVGIGSEVEVIGISNMGYDVKDVATGGIIKHNGWEIFN